ncbi:MAG: DUF5615 family PIN-like protein [Nocardioidaceae bacterium]
MLDEHYPGWLAAKLVADGIDTVSLAADCPDRRGLDDSAVLRAAVAAGRIVVTEDVTTFGVAIARAPDHLGAIYCHDARFPRTRPGLRKLRKALVALVKDPPEGRGSAPVVWWLASP